MLVSPTPLTNVYVNVFPASGSVVDNVPTVVPVATFSSIDELDNDMFVGVSLTLVTLIVNDSSLYKPPWSVDLTLTE